MAIEITFNHGLQSSTHLIDNIKRNALELSAQIGQGFTLKIDVINNKEKQNCNIFMEKLRID